MSDVRSLRELTATTSGDSVAVLESLSEVFAFDRGVWLVGHSASWIEPDDQSARKVRLVTLHVVVGERDD